MKIIYKIAKAELQILFYSPIAWLILILFTFQTSMDFSGLLDGIVRSKAMGYELSGLTSRLFGGWEGIFVTVQGSLYLYIPLLTMNLMSREFSSGSIKLLYSSPVTNAQIIIGKYLAMIVYSLVLMLILCVYVLYGAFTIENFSYPTIFTGLLGLFLLALTYSAIGLFMSSITSYQVVAAIGTLAALTILNYISGWWQDVAFVRDLTYWLAMPGRSMEFVKGMICTENVIYFLMVIGLFLGMAILRLQSCRQKKSWIRVWGQYLGIWAVALCIGYISSRPVMKKYYDSTETKSNTITPNSQDIVARMKGDVKITTYVNLLDRYFWIGMPERINEDLKLFEQYLRFKPDIDMEYVYYYDKAINPDFDNHFPNLTLEEKFKKMVEINNLDPDMFLKPGELNIDLSDENNRFVRVIEYDGKKTFLRVFDDNMIFPTEAEISAAFKRLVMRLPKVGFLTGHEERPTDNYGERSYSMFAQMHTFRHSLINQGFDYTDISLEQEIPDDVDILVIAEMRKPLTDSEMAFLDKYIARGGNLLIAGEPKRQDVMNPVVERLGLRFMPGCIVHPTVEYPADLVLATPTKEACELSYWFKTLRSYGYGISMPSATSMEVIEDKGFTVVPLFATDSTGYWNELSNTDFVDGKTELETDKGEVEKSYTVAMALSRKVGDKEQKIMVLGDADCISNGEFTRGRAGIQSFNYYLISGGFCWMSDNEVPVDVRRPSSSDTQIQLTESSNATARTLFMWVWPLSMLMVAIVIWLRRRGR